MGTVDYLWKLGKPRGHGGPWKDAAVELGVPSGAYLMNGYDPKRLSLSHTASGTMNFRVEVNPTGDGCWIGRREFPVAAGARAEHQFPDAFAAAWVRVTSDRATKATAEFLYE